jgi:hypothetical protein
VPDGDRIDHPDRPGRRWRYHDLAWHAAASAGLDYAGHRLWARVVGDRLVVQHGDNPEATRAFGLDQLNRVGRPWDDDPVLAWCQEIDGRGVR